MNSAPSQDVFMIVNLISTCKMGKCLPETESDWSKSEILKTLRLSGVSTTIPHNYDYADLVMLLITRLNQQIPCIYAMVTRNELGTYVILNSRGMSYSKGWLYSSPHTVLRLGSGSPEELFDVFEKHYIATPRIVIPTGFDSEEQQKIRQLQTNIRTLTKQLQSSPAAVVNRQFEEANVLLNSYKDQLETVQSEKIKKDEEQVRLKQELQSLKASEEIIRMKLDKIRKQMANQTDDQILEEITQIPTLRAELKACRENASQILGQIKQ